MNRTSVRARPNRYLGDTARLAQLARQRTELDRDDFARVIGVSPALVAGWELGLARPAGAEVTLLELIAADPSVCLRLLG